jgi:hypothetical protein
MVCLKKEKSVINYWFRAFQLLKFFLAQSAYYQRKMEKAENEKMALCEHKPWSERLDAYYLHHLE